MKDGIDPELLSYLEKSFKFITNRITRTVNFTFNNLLNREKMCFNDIQYSFIVCNLMFLTNMVEFIGNIELKNSYKNLKEQFVENLPYLNCFTQKYLNEF